MSSSQNIKYEGLLHLVQKQKQYLEGIMINFAGFEEWDSLVRDARTSLDDFSKQVGLLVMHTGVPTFTVIEGGAIEWGNSAFVQLFELEEPSSSSSQSLSSPSTVLGTSRGGSRSSSSRSSSSSSLSTSGSSSRSSTPQGKAKHMYLFDFVDSDLYQVHVELTSRIASGEINFPGWITVQTRFLTQRTRKPLDGLLCIRTFRVGQTDTRRFLFQFIPIAYTSYEDFCQRNDIHLSSKTSSP